jgi:hypothetical protein
MVALRILQRTQRVDVAPDRIKVHFMRFKNSYAAAVAAAVSAVVFSAAFQPAEASFIFYVEQVGPNVVITGTGSFITSGSDALPFADSVPVSTPVISTGTSRISIGPVGATQNVNFYGAIFSVLPGFPWLEPASSTDATIR